MIGTLLFWFLAGAAVGAIVVYVAGKITAKKIKEEARKNSITKCVIDRIDNCNNVVKLKDLESNKVLEIHGDEVDKHLEKGDVIRV